MDFWGNLVRLVAFPGCSCFHVLNTQFVCHFFGSVLGHHGSLYLSFQNDNKQSMHPHHSGLDLFQSHLFPSHPLVEGDKRWTHCPFNVPFYTGHRLPSFLVHYFLLRAIVRHGLYLLPHLQSCCPTNKEFKVGNETLYGWGCRTHPSYSQVGTWP